MRKPLGRTFTGEWDTIFVWSQAITGRCKRTEANGRSETKSKDAPEPLLLVLDRIKIQSSNLRLVASR